MKHILLFLVFSFSTFVLPAQTYFPIGTVWNYNYSISDMGCPVGTCWYGQETLKVVSDTMVNTIPGSKLFYFTHEWFYHDPQNIYYSSGLFGYLFQKNDSILFSTDGTLQNATYIFGFNMQVSDTLVIDANMSISVDSIKSENISGQLRKVFYVTKFYPNGTLGESYSVHKIVDGIGPIDDYLLWDQSYGEYGTYHSLVCFNNGSIVYPEGAACTPLSTLKSETDIFSVYPNPCKDYIEISSSHIPISLIEVFNSEGNLVQSVIPKNISDNYRLGFTSLPNGFYLLKISNDERIYSTKKILIQN